MLCQEMILILALLFAISYIHVANGATSVINVNTKIAVSNGKLLTPKTNGTQVIDCKNLRRKIQEVKKNVEVANKKISKQQEDITDLNKKMSKLNSTYQPIGVCHLENIDCGRCRCQEDERLLRKYFCDCRNVAPVKDCLTFKKHGYHTNGVYIIKPNEKPFQIFCDQTTDGGGWSVFQRRLDGSIKFYRDWQHYKRGFGATQHEFWLGNDHLFELTNNPRNSELRIDMEYFDAGWKKFYAKYNKFAIGNEDSKYALHVSGYSGNNGDSLGNQHNGMKFSTFDQDNDQYSAGSCAQLFKGAWWYNRCHSSNLNGRYFDYKDPFPNSGGLHWGTYDKHKNTILVVEMKMRQKW